MADETEHVGARVPPAQKGRWKQAQEQSEHDTMTEWLKWVVESHLQGYNSPDSGASSEDMSKVLDELDRLRDDLGRLETRVGESKQVEREATYDMRRVLMELLPTGDSAGITPDEMAERIGADVSEVRDELVALQNSTGGVVATIDDDGNHRYKNEGDY